MRIAIFCTAEAIFHPPMLHEVLSRHRGSIAGICIFTPPGRSGLRAAMAEAVRLDGWRALPRMAWRALDHRRLALLRSPPNFASIDALLRHHRIDAARFKSPNVPGVLNWLNALEPDVLLNFQPWYLKAPVLQGVRRACLNMHTAALPKYRGVQPVVRAMLAGDDRIGVTIHSMVPEIDAGSIMAQTTVTSGQSAFEIYQSAFAEVPDLIDEALAAINRGSKGIPIAPTSPYYGPLSEAEFAAFRHQGLRYL